MATIILNKSKCPICGKVIKEGESLVGFPPFAGDEKDPLFYFSDRGFHKVCFLNHPLKNKVLAAVKKYDKEVHLPPNKSNSTRGGVH